MTKRIFAMFTACVLLMFSAGCGSTEKTAIDMTPSEIAESFNKAASDTNFRLSEVKIGPDNTFTILTADDGVYVSGTLDGGKVSEIEVESIGIFEPSLATYDYMVYMMMACDDTVEFDHADDLIADFYYEAYYGGEEVIGGYNGLQYAFQKADGQYWFRIRNI
ncbi:MAG: hypothetical protein LUD03_00110 [Firmicutes bacterium]|nr:hypothetical protein [Bacillota bacterium]